MASAGTITVDLKARTASFETDMQRASRAAQKRSREIEASAKRMGAALGAAFVAAGAAAVFAVKQAIDNADRINDISQRLGVGAEALSGWGYAARQSGTDMESLNTGLTRFTKNIAEAADSSSAQGEIFKALGIDVKDAAGNLKSVEELLPQIADSFKSLENPTLESALALQLFGRSGADLLQLLNEGSGGLAAYQDRLRSLGGELSGSTVKAADEFNDTLDDIKTSAGGVATQIAAALLPSLTKAAQGAAQFASDGDNARRIADSLAVAMNGVGTAIKFVAFVGQGIGVTLAALVEGLKATYEIASNIVTLGAAGGSISGAISRQQANGKQFQEEIARLKNGSSSKPQVQFITADSGSVAESAFKRSSGEAQALAQAKALQDRLNKVLSGGASKSGGSGDSAAKKAAAEAKRAAEEAIRKAKEAAEAQAQWNGTILDMQASLDGPVAEAQRQYARSISELNLAYNEGKVTLGDYAKAQEIYAEQRDRALEAIAKEKTQSQQVIEDMEFELKLLGLTNAEREKEIAQRYLGADATELQRKRVDELTESIQKGLEVQKAWNSVQGELSDAMFDFVSGAKSAEDAIKSFFDSVAQNILRAITEKWSEQLTNMLFSRGTGSGGGGGFDFGSLLGSLFGGARASGGPVRDDKMYLVGERGPEMFVPNTAGSIVPSGRTQAMMGGRNFTQVVNQNFNGPMTKQTARQSASEVGRASQRQLSRGTA